MRYNGTDMETLLVANSQNISFSSLNLSNSGNYSCRVIVRSRYLDNSITANSNLVSIIQQGKLNSRDYSTILFIILIMYWYTAPPPSSVLLMSPTDNIFAGNDFSVACIVRLPPTVDIPVNVDIEWSEPAGATLNYIPTMTTENPNEYTSIADVVSNVQSERISFQCAANVDSDSLFITASDSGAANVSVFVVGRPSQPTGLDTNVDPTNTDITWSTRDGDIVYGYELQYDYHIQQCPNNTGMMSSINISNHTNRHTLEHLEEDSVFNISLIAFNPAGRSEPAIAVATTLPSGTVKFKIDTVHNIN
jgi:hypothetical protein